MSSFRGRQQDLFCDSFPSAATSFLNLSSFDVLVHRYVIFHSVLVLLCHLQPLWLWLQKTQVNHVAPTLARHDKPCLSIRSIHGGYGHPSDWWTCCCTENPTNLRNFTIFQLGDAPFTQEAHNLWLGWLRNLNVWSCRSIFVNVTPSHPGENLRKPRVHWKSGCWDANASSSNRDPILPPQWTWVRRWLQTATTPTVDLPKRKAPQSKVIYPKTFQLQTSNRNTIF